MMFVLAILHGFWYEIMLLFFIVIMHELGHVCTALHYGWRVSRISILPFGGVAEVEEHGNRPCQEEFAVIIAGPVMNVIMICFASLCLWLGLWSSSFAVLFIEYNLIILSFNLLPILPLDGGKLMQVGFSLFLPFKQAIRRSILFSNVSVSIGMIVLLFFFAQYFTLWIIALFLCMAQWLEWKQSYYQYLRFLLERYKHQQSFVQPFDDRDVVSLVVSTSIQLQDALARMLRNKWHYFCLVNKRGECVHILSEKELLDAYFSEHQPTLSLADLVS